MCKLSVIVPYCLEYPQVIFTIRSIAEDLIGRADFEIIAVDNFCNQVANQGFKIDRGTDMIKSMSDQHEWLKYIRYDDQLSHWNAKRIGIQQATGDVFAFIDAHCIVGRDLLFRAYDIYRNGWRMFDGTLHLPLTYHILENKRLQYKLKYNPDTWEMHYAFTPLSPPNGHSAVYEVPCMSTCGMLIHREIYEATGGWPEVLGIYGGGENFMNFVLAILGKKKFIYHADSALYHHGEKRNYRFNWDDMNKNRAVAAYMYGGMRWMDGFLRNLKGATGRYILKTEELITDACFDQRQQLKSNAVCSIEDWASGWVDKEKRV
jgi:glycosyltransferase involved in cell wall biosynthesis